QSGSPNGATEETSSCSETLIRRGSGSCVRFFMPQRVPPVTIVATTRLNLRQRSNPPWAATMLASNLFTVGLHEVLPLLVFHRQHEASVVRRSSEPCSALD